jgi:hypothetical protein
LRSTVSRTLAAPRTTRVSVAPQVSCVSHLVPLTVAALYCPRVRKEPDPSPHRRRVFFFFFFFAAADARPDCGQLSFSVSASVVTGFEPLVWVS